ncbi:hypothetical protein MMC07_001910 [Pseudocyphellaria aurata]|nr:hypothetical protein [Pseudocyphellaria aurata]
MTDRHNKAVAEIAANVRQFYDRKEKFRIFHGSTNSTRPSDTLRDNVIDLSGLDCVLNVNTKARTVLVEPNVPMDRLVQTTLKYGLVPPVVMEFPGITVGGGYAGTSGESSSFKHGFFDRTINSVEMVLANGEIVVASDHEKADLFHGAAGAAGSLGVTTLVELRLEEAKAYVEITYLPVKSTSEAIRKCQEVTTDPKLDYVDGILYSKKQGVIITGRLTNDLDPSLNLQRFSRAKDPWFFLHVQNAASQSDPTMEVIPLWDYLFRYDRGAFWVGKYGFKYFLIPFNRFTRWLLDGVLRTRMMYKALHASGYSKQFVVQDLALPYSTVEQFVVQDLALPYSTVEQFVDYTDETFGIYPLWLCPLRQSPLPTLHPHSSESEADEKSQLPLINIGLWGPGSTNSDAFVQVNRGLEHKLQEFGGTKWLYAHTYYTEAEFWRIYDRKWYDALRAKYDATSLPSVWEKVKVKVEVPSWPSKLLSFWPICGIWGLLCALWSGHYRLAWESQWESIEEKDRMG